LCLGRQVAKKPLTDNQWAIIFVIALTFVAVVLSMVINYIMSDAAEPEDSLHRHQHNRMYHGDEYDNRYLQH
jgi:hypothetical protein